MAHTFPLYDLLNRKPNIPHLIVRSAANVCGLGSGRRLYAMDELRDGDLSSILIDLADGPAAL
jgi:hypothetical protein